MESRFFNASLETEIHQKRLKGSKNRVTKSLKAFINCCREKNITRRKWIKKYRISKNPRELLGKITWREKEINDEQKKISRYGKFPIFLINVCLWLEAIYSWSKRREMKTVSELQAHLKRWFCSVICQLKPDSHMLPGHRYGICEHFSPNHHWPPACLRFQARHGQRLSTIWRRGK